MDNILKALYNHFYCQPENIPQEMQINVNHQSLRQRLCKRNRKLVLRIIDDLDSFICGFRLAWLIANRIQNYDGCSDCSQGVEPVPVSYFQRR